MVEPFVLPETAAVLAGLAAQEGPHLADMSAADMRATYGALGTMFDAPPEAGVRSIDVQGGGVPLRAYFPVAAQAGPVIVYMHGGGWVIGDLETHHPLCTMLAAVTGLRVVAVDYRLAPEHPYPAAHDDCLAAARWVAGSPPELEAPVSGIAVAGDSAGGNLALHVATKMGSDTVKAQLLIYPVGDCTAPDHGSYKQFAEGYVLDRKLMDRFIGDYLPDPARAGEPAVSPVLHPVPADLPPTIILTAGLDPLRDQGRALAGLIAATGTEVHFIEAQGLIHGLATMRGAFPTADRIMRRAGRLLADLMRG
ncbi:alpha/beta hydrolase [Novosphingobium sp.]|uniref:alpha/beta hydrolase n=1 Tax=Novosphingobium sp. TaxID=1874826 RepID=UPI0038BAA332|nr:alpha/beta hydrolase [Pseudomonadota bacterium]